MTDPKLTTNEEIALELGWVRLGPGVRRNPDGSIWNGVPDFEHDWAHAGPLLEELPDGVQIQITHWPHSQEAREFQCRLTLGPILLGAGYGKTREAATSRAWLAWKKEEG